MKLGARSYAALSIETSFAICEVAQIAFLEEFW